MLKPVLGGAASGDPQHLTGDSDRELVARVQAGDERAFEELVLAHYHGMCSTAFTLLRSRDAVEDIVQNVLRKVWTNRENWQPPGPPRAYLLRATRHETINIIRRLRRERALVGHIVEHSTANESGVHRVPGMGEIPAAIDDALIVAELRAAIETAAAQLPPRCREVFSLRWQAGLRQTEIAVRMGTSIKTVEMQMTRALKAIRAHLAEVGLP